MVIVAKRACCKTVFAAVSAEHAHKADITEFQGYASIGCVIGIAKSAQIEACKCTDSEKAGRNQLPADL